MRVRTVVLCIISSLLLAQAKGHRCCRSRRDRWTPRDFDGPFTAGGQTSAVVGGKDDPEPGLRFDPPRAGSHTVTLGEPDVT
jgi:hypothetical protein